MDFEKNTTASQFRSFGLIVGSVFAVIGFWPLLLRGERFRLWSLVIAGLLVIPALVMPNLLKPIYQIWMRIGAVLGWINTRIILGIGFYLVFTPIGIVMRLFGKDPLHRKFTADATTYRVIRSSRPNSHMQNQY